MMKIESKRLILRELTENDFSDMYETLADSDVTRHYPYEFNEERVRGWITKNIARYDIFGFGLWAITLRDTGEVIGDCGLTMQVIDGVIKPEIGYHIKRSHRRMGYAAEAAAACRDWAFTNTPFNKIYSYMQKDNIASAAVARANKMLFAGDYTDAQNEISSVYFISRSQWKKLKIEPDGTKNQDKI